MLKFHNDYNDEDSWFSVFNIGITGTLRWTNGRLHVPFWRGACVREKGGEGGDYVPLRFYEPAQLAMQREKAVKDY